MKILMIDGVEYDTGAEISHLLDWNRAELQARTRGHDERGYEIGDDPIAPARGLLWAIGIEFLMAIMVAWIVS